MAPALTATSLPPRKQAFRDASFAPVAAPRVAERRHVIAARLRRPAAAARARDHANSPPRGLPSSDAPCPVESVARCCAAARRPLVPPLDTLRLVAPRRAAQHRPGVPSGDALRPVARLARRRAAQHRPGVPSGDALRPLARLARRRAAEHRPRVPSREQKLVMFGRGDWLLQQEARKPKAVGETLGRFWSYF